MESKNEASNIIENDSLRGRYGNSNKPIVFPVTDEYGFITDKMLESSNFYSIIKMQWFLIIDKYGNDKTKFKKSIKKQKLLEKGVPLSLKNRVWTDLLLENARLQEIELLNKLRIKENKKPLIKEKMLKKDDLLLQKQYNANYEAYKAMPCKYEYQIHVDVQRTFRHHILFFEKYSKGQSELFNLLIGIANSIDETGYCQGMSDICAVLLMYFSESEAYRIYNLLIYKNDLLKLFDKNLSKLPEIVDKQKKIFIEKIPEIELHLKTEKIDFSFYSMGWYLTLFSRFNIRLVLRIWDYLFFYGFDILIYFASAILKNFEKEILSKKNEELLIFINKISDMKIDEDIVVSILEFFIFKKILS